MSTRTLPRVSAANSPRDESGAKAYREFSRYADVADFHPPEVGPRCQLQEPSLETDERQRDIRADGIAPRRPGVRVEP